MGKIIFKRKNKIIGYIIHDGKEWHCYVGKPSDACVCEIGSREDKEEAIAYFTNFWKNDALIPCDKDLKIC